MMMKLPDYNGWTLSLGRHFFRNESDGKAIVLNCDVHTLFVCIQKYHENIFEYEDIAFQAFVTVIREKLESLQWNWEHASYASIPDKTRGLTYHGAFLLIIAQILAAYRMRRSTETGHASYWRCLSDMLGLDQSNNKLPFGLTYSVHADLWKSFIHWVNTANGGEFGVIEVPMANRGSRRYVNMLLSQALFRRVDLEKLADINGFYEVILDRNITLDRLKKYVKRYYGESRFFSSHAQRVLDPNNDPELFDLACKQIRDDYQSKFSEAPILPPIRRDETIHYRSEIRISNFNVKSRLHIRVVRAEEEAPLSPDQINVFLGPNGTFGILRDFKFDFPRLNTPPALFFFSSIEHCFVQSSSIPPGQHGMLLVFGSVEAWLESWEQVLVAQPTVFAGVRQPEKSCSMACPKDGTL